MICIEFTETGTEKRRDLVSDYTGSPYRTLVCVEALPLKYCTENGTLIKQDQWKESRMTFAETLFTNFVQEVIVLHTYLLAGESLLSTGFSPGRNFESLSIVSAGASAVISDNQLTLNNSTHRVSSKVSSHAHRTPLPCRSPHPCA